MAAKKKPEPPPPSESESSGSGSEDSSEDEAMDSQSKSPVTKVTVANSLPEVKPSGEESSGSSSEDDENSEDEVSEDEAAPAVNPVTSSLPETSGESAESGSGSDAESDHEATAKASVEAAAAVAKSDDARKRVATGSETADVKPAKRVRASTPVSLKSREDDEIAILTGASGYMEKGSDPLNDAKGFYEFVKESLNHHSNPGDVVGTLKRLKRRYQSTESNAKRGKGAVPNGGNRKTIFELSKTMWNKRKGAKIEDSAVTSPDKKKSKKMQGSNRKVLEFEPETEIERPEQKSTGLVNGHPREETVNGHPRKETAIGHPGKDLLFSCWNELKNDENVGLKLMKEGLELLEPSMVRRLGERWKKIEIAKFDILQKQRDLLQEQMELVLDALKQKRK